MYKYLNIKPYFFPKDPGSGRFPGGKKVSVMKNSRFAAVGSQRKIFRAVKDFNLGQTLYFYYYNPAIKKSSHWEKTLMTL